MDPTDPILDPLATLAFAAATTTKVVLATGVVLLPQRNPVALAKEAATVDVLSGGRLVLGVGVANLEPEMTAVGTPMAGRGQRSIEYVEAMRELWSSDIPEYHGKYVSFAGIDAHPRPVRRDIPIVRGGRSDSAFRHSVADCHGWVGFFLDLEATAECLEGIHRAVQSVARAPDLPSLEITVTPRKLEAGDVERFEDLGVHRLTLLMPQNRELKALEEWLHRHAPGV